MSRSGKRDGARALPARAVFRWPRAHPPRPVLVIAVADDESERRPQRPAVPQSREHFDPILLELLPRAAAIALLTSPEIAVDRVSVEHEAGGQAAHDRDERWPVRLTGRSKLERHTGKPTAARIASMGAGTPVQSSNEAAPCATRPPTRRSPSHPPDARPAAVAVSGYGRSTASGRAPARRAPHRVRTSRSPRAQPPPRSAASRPPGVAPRLRKRVRERRGRLAVADDHRGPDCEPRREWPRPSPSFDSTVAYDERVHGRRVGPAELCDRELVRRRDVGTGEAERSEPGRRIGQPLGTLSAAARSTQSRPSAANAAFCILGESEWSTGQPMMPTSFGFPWISLTRRPERPIGRGGAPLVHAHCAWSMADHWRRVPAPPDRGSSWASRRKYLPPRLRVADLDPTSPEAVSCP